MGGENLLLDLYRKCEILISAPKNSGGTIFGTFFSRTKTLPFLSLTENPTFPFWWRNTIKSSYKAKFCNINYIVIFCSLALLLEHTLGSRNNFFHSFLFRKRWQKKNLFSVTLRNFSESAKFVTTKKKLKKYISDC